MAVAFVNGLLELFGRRLGDAICALMVLVTGVLLRAIGECC